MKHRSVMIPLLNDMLTGQGRLNRVAIGDLWWEKPECDFHLAVQQECAEAIDHLGWKWWTTQVTDLPAAQMEAVDVLHFVLSIELREYLNADGPGPEDLIDALVQDYYSRGEGITVDARSFEPKNMGTRELFQLISVMAGLNHNAFGLTCLVAEKLGLTFLELSRLYRAKLTLNIFRQEHGYKQGTYKKLWANVEEKGSTLVGTEDNTVMQGFLGQVDWTADKAVDKLYALLEETYAAVLKTHYTS